MLRCEGGAGRQGTTNPLMVSGLAQSAWERETESEGATDISACKCGAGYRYDAGDSANPCKFCHANQYKPHVENTDCTTVGWIRCSCSHGY